MIQGLARALSSARLGKLGPHLLDLGTPPSSHLRRLLGLTALRDSTNVLGELRHGRAHLGRGLVDVVQNSGEAR